MSTEAAPMSDTPEREVVPPDAPSGDTAPRPRRTRRPRRWTRALPWVVAVLALAAAVYSTWQWRQLASRQDAIASARAAAVDFTRDLTNWDASDGLDDEVEVLRNQGTGAFLDEIEFVFGGDELTSQLQADEISATGEVEEVFVQDLEGDVAEVFAVVSVTYDSPNIENGLDPVSFPASMVLERAGDGGWLVREVTVPNTNQIGQLMAPPASGEDGS